MSLDLRRPRASQAPSDDCSARSERAWWFRRYDVDRDNREDAWLQRLHAAFRPALWWYFQPRVDGLEHVPPGACLFVGNHNGAMLMMDMVLLGAALYDRFGPQGVPLGLAHRLAVRLPVMHGVLARLGAVRGTSHNGLELLRRGRKLLVYPGGELDSMRTYWDRKRVVFGARRGYVRLALRAAVPIVPVVTAGAHETLLVLATGERIARAVGLDRRWGLCAWPLTLSIPWGLWLGIPPPHFPLRTRVRIALLEPITFERTGEQAARDRSYVEACHERVHGEMQRALERLCDGATTGRGDEAR